MSHRYSPVDEAAETVDILLIFDEVAVTADNVDWRCPDDVTLGEDGAGDITDALCGIISSSYDAVLVKDVVD